MLKDLLKGKSRDITPKSRACCMDGMGADILITENNLSAGEVEIPAGTFAKIEAMMLNGCVPNIVFYRSKVGSGGIRSRIVTKPFRIQYTEYNKIELWFTTSHVFVSSTSGTNVKTCSYDELVIKPDDSFTFTKHVS